MKTTQIINELIRPEGELEAEEKTVGNYTVFPKYILGKGSHSTVCLGILKDGSKEINVAVKMFAIKNVTPQIRKGIDMELNVLTNIKHCNILNLLDSMESPNYIYFFTEYCSGGIIRIKNQRRLY
jgi:serine/threonine protein kinase